MLIKKRDTNDFYKNHVYLDWILSPIYHYTIISRKCQTITLIPYIVGGTHCVPFQIYL